MANKKWMQQAQQSMERRGTVGSLRKLMGVKEGEKISTASLLAKRSMLKRAEKAGKKSVQGVSIGNYLKKINFALNAR